uniref:Photosystem I P700 apoprotein A2 n=1 Tax=Commiphora gileadensis TaxID=1700993 RepID=A0A410PA71_9ROSI|nr:photosystem I P700 apoprotein A2 [Commiphora gileadensis]QAT19696.1 photosystem I P700 apoprotein A2 [Commiphora gileadensis]
MALRFPRFSQGLAQDPTTRRIWFGIATAHDFESHDDITEERLYQNIFASHFGQLAIIFLWTSGNLFHVAWQGNFEAWVQDPLHVRPIAHAIWDPHFGQPAVEAFSRGGALGPVNIAYSGVYQWWYTIGLRTNEDLYTGALFLLFLSAISLIAGWLHLQPKWKPSVSWFKNAESRLNHHLSGLFGVSSLAWTGHLVHVAIPGSRGEYVRWNNFLDVLPHPQGLGPLFTGQWNLYAQNPDSSSHLFGTSQGSGTAILTLLGGFHPQTQSLWLTDIAHHHLAIAFIFLVAGHMYRTNFGIGHSIKDLLEAHIPPGGRLGRGHKGLYDTINNSLHFQLGLALASLGVITSLVAQHMYSLPAYAFIAQDFTTQAALYTHHQYIAGFIMTGAFAHGAIFFYKRLQSGTERGQCIGKNVRPQRSYHIPFKLGQLVSGVSYFGTLCSKRCHACFWYSGETNLDRTDICPMDTICSWYNFIWIRCTFIFNEWPSIQCGSKHMVAWLVKCCKCEYKFTILNNRSWRLLGSSCYCSRFTYNYIDLSKGCFRCTRFQVNARKKGFRLKFSLRRSGTRRYLRYFGLGRVLFGSFLDVKYHWMGYFLLALEAHNIMAGKRFTVKRILHLFDGMVKRLSMVKLFTTYQWVKPVWYEQFISLGVDVLIWTSCLGYWIYVLNFLARLLAGIDRNLSMGSRTHTLGKFDSLERKTGGSFHCASKIGRISPLFCRLYIHLCGFLDCFYFGQIW